MKPKAPGKDSTAEDSSRLPGEPDLGAPGEFPYTRGIYPEMYRRRLWTMRQYAGFGDAAERIQELYLGHHKDEANAAVPDEFVDQGALIGPEDRIRKRFRDWEDSSATGLTIGGDEQALRLMADIARLNAMPDS